MLLMTITLLVILIGLIYIYLIWNFGYWRKLGVKEHKCLPVVGSYPSAFTQKRHIVWDLDDIYRLYKREENFVGIFGSRIPQLLILNPELARRVLVTDFKHFHDNEASKMVDKHRDAILSKNPFVLTGNEWKEVRSEISPGLSNSRIKAVYPVTLKVCKKLTDYLREQSRMAPKDGIDTKDVCFRYTSEIVMDCVLGIQSNSFSKEPLPIIGMVQKIFDNSLIVIIYQIVLTMLPWLKYLYQMSFVPPDIEEYFVELVQSAIDLRRTADEKLRERNDFLNYVMQLQDKKMLSTTQVASHTMTFLLDGFETTASVIAHCLLLLARNADKLEKLKDEISMHIEDPNVEVEFDTLMELPYLDACIHESIRIFPPGVFANKLCTEPIEFTNKNGRKLRLEKGQTVVVPMASFMFDEDYYPNPQEFIPERFLEETDGLKKFRDRGLFYGFSDGPRICIGMRFGLAQAKAAIVEIVKNFNVRVNPKTQMDNTLDPAYFIARPKDGVWLDFEPKS